MSVPFLLIHTGALLADAQAAWQAFLTLFFVLTFNPVFIGLNAVYKWGTTGSFYFLVWIIALFRLTLGRASSVVIGRGSALHYQGISAALGPVRQLHPQADSSR